MKRNNVILKILSGLALGVVVISLGLIIYISFQLKQQAFFPVPAGTEALPTTLVDRVSLEFDEKTPNYEQFTITTRDGYELEAAYVPAEQASKQYVIFVHGITRNLQAMMKFYPMYHDQGYNVIFFSLRNHGGNEADITSYGVEEKYDLADVVDYTYERFGSDITLGLHGVSMGAAISLQYAGLPEAQIDFLISDCAYQSAEAELNYQLSEQYPQYAWFPFVRTTGWLTQATEGIDLYEASAIKAVANIEEPVYFIHGLADTFIPPTDAVELYQAKTTGERELWLVPEAGHDAAIETDTANYEANVIEFINQYVTN
ncbi:MAG: alpha/beta hydrolase [Culicoidibacterales bacterium]